VEAARAVRVLCRTRAGSAVIHVLNYSYDPSLDDVTPVENVRLTVDASALGLTKVDRATLLTLDGSETRVECRDGQVTIPRLGLWALVRLESGRQ